MRTVPLFTYEVGDGGVAQPDDGRMKRTAITVYGTDETVSYLDLIPIHDNRHDVAGVEKGTI